MKEICAVDIGNTATTFVIVKDAKVVAKKSIATDSSKNEYQKNVRKRLNILLRKSLVERVLICSVVPEATVLVERALSKFKKIQAFVIGRDIRVPIKNRYRNPRQVGQDRLVCAFAASKLYGPPCIVIDLGTAITFDVVSRKGEYQGGIIVPGLKLSTEALSQKTAMLPMVKITRPKNLIGKDTAGSILSGLFYGYGALCDGLTDRLSQRIKGKPALIATGGYIQLLKKYICKSWQVEKDLAFKGIGLIDQQKPSGLH